MLKLTKFLFLKTKKQDMRYIELLPHFGPKHALIHFSAEMYVSKQIDVKSLLRTSGSSVYLLTDTDKGIFRPIPPRTHT